MDDKESKRLAREYFDMAYQAQTKGHLEKAVELYKKSIESFATSEAHTFLGWTYSFRGWLDEAIEECYKAIEADPDFGNPYNDIGAYLIEKGQLDEAVPWLEKAINAKRYDSYCFPHMNLGRIWERKGLWYQAVESYKQALECNSDYDTAAQALSRVRGMLN